MAVDHFVRVRVEGRCGLEVEIGILALFFDFRLISGLGTFVCQMDFGGIFESEASKIDI